MKTKAESKHKSLWRNIRINVNGRIIYFELNEQGKMKNKLPRQHARDLSIEIDKISLGRINSPQTLMNTSPSPPPPLTTISTTSNTIPPIPCTTISNSYTQDLTLTNYFYQPSFTNPNIIPKTQCNQIFGVNLIPKSTMNIEIESNSSSNSNSSCSSSCSCSSNSSTSESEGPDEIEESVQGLEDPSLAFTDYFEPESFSDFCNNHNNNIFSDDNFIDDYSNDQNPFEDDFF